MRIPSLVLISALLLPLPALADTFTYTYTGNDFTNQSNNSDDGTPYTTSDFVSGSVTLAAPLSDNSASNVHVSALSFSFSDGVQIITNMTPGLDPLYTFFAFQTDALGSIIGWDINMEDSDPNLNEITSQSVSGQSNYAIDSGMNDEIIQPSDGDAFYSLGLVRRPGTWTVTDNPTSAAAPEPSSLLLLATGLVGSAGLIRRRLPQA